MFITLTDVKLNNEYDYINSVAPTTSENAAAGYSNGERWLDSTTGFSYELTEEVAGTWTRIEITTDFIIDRNKDNICRTVFEFLGNPFRVMRNEAYDIQTYSIPQNLTAKQLDQLLTYESLFSEFTFSASAKTITAGDDLFGDITNFAIGDIIYVDNSLRNDNFYTIGGLNTTTNVITVLEDIQDETANAFINFSSIPDAINQITARMLWFDTYLRNQTGNKVSERIGTYSYTLDTNVNGILYPNNIVAGLSAFERVCIGGISNYVR